MANVQVPESPIIKEVLRYSERIERLRIEVDNATIATLSFKGLNGHASRRLG